MKKTLSLLGWLVAGVLLILNPRTGLVPASSAAVTAAASSGTTTTTSGLDTGEPPTTLPATSGEATTSTTVAPAITSAGETTAVGQAVSTRFGNFQVEATVDNGVLVDVTVLQQPGDRRSNRINSQAFPAYEQMAIQSQGTGFDALSGATITWRAFTASLQSALDSVGM